MASLTLTAFRVTGFRSVDDSDWIDAGSMTALIGTNEAGKTNLLLPLWKFNPAQDGEIKPTSDYPRKSYNDIRNLDTKPVFIQVRFDVSEALANELAAIAKAPAAQLRKVEVHRRFDGLYDVYFPEATPLRELPRDEIVELLEKAREECAALAPLKTETALHEQIVAALVAALESLQQHEGGVDKSALAATTTPLSAIDLGAAPKTSAVAPRFQQLLDSLVPLDARISAAHPETIREARQLVISRLPKFVYYSNYGNLDSEIYLPHVIENLKREDLGSKEEAKARTLKVLFEFVKLSAQEIRELGEDVDAPNPEQLEEITEKKKERDILLQSAGTSLTRSFRDWWKQGEYRFRFAADGNHFRIWVSDDLRPEDIELEGRSAGLQWFLSFYLVFLVESRDAHEGAVLLLDEPGHSLHPLAQEDLSAFFESLVETNQLLYTTHSPFLVDPDHLDRVKAVYVGDDGATCVSSDLRAPEKRSAQARSVYPVHAALGLSVSRTMLQGCQPIIVEGHSDQLYLSAIKNYLVANGLISPPRELLFIPAGGSKGARAVLPIFAGAEDVPPFALLDDDPPGRRLAKNLKDDLYRGNEDRVLNVAAFTGLEGSEIEDVWPVDFLADAITKLMRGPEEEFSDVVDSSKPIVDQAEAYAEKHGIGLDKPGWKVDVAERVKARLLLRGTQSIATDSKEAQAWVKLFEAILKN